MPHVRRRMLITLAAPEPVVREHLATTLGLTPVEAADGHADEPGPATFSGPAGATPSVLGLAATVEPGAGPGTTDVLLESGTDLTVPYFGWFVHAMAWIGARNAVRDAAARLQASIEGTEPPRVRRLPSLLPPVEFTDEQAARLAALAAAAVLASFCGALLTQNSDAVTHTFHKTDQDLGLALAIARAGVLVSLVVSLLSDRMGRRRLILF